MNIIRLGKGVLVGSWMIIMLGCSMGGKPRSEDLQSNKYKPVRVSSPSNSLQTPKLYDMSAFRTDHGIEKHLEQIPHVVDARVIMVRKDAYVGLRMAANDDQTVAFSLKKEVIHQIKKVDPSVQTVYVSKDPTFYHELKNYATEIERGRPRNDMAQRFQELAKRTFPDMR